MADTIKLIDPKQIVPNRENPRLIFRAEELQALEDSIKLQGILVPLAVYEENERTFVILDGERRWRCALKLGLSKVPAIIQPKPDRMTNIMMMFAIHNARRDWDPLPTAYKLRDLEEEFSKRHKRPPSEQELAELASMRRGEVRRLKKLLGLPEIYRTELMAELEKPRSQQTITVDHVLEATKGAAALVKREIIPWTAEDRLRRVIIDKFKSGVVANTIAPRQLSRIARAVERKNIPLGLARSVVDKFVKDAAYSIDDAFNDSVAQADFQHGVEILLNRLLDRLQAHSQRDYHVTDRLRQQLGQVQALINQILGAR